MKSKLRLIFKNVSEIVGNEEIGLLVLTDEAEKRQLTIPCDKAMLIQFGIRLNHLPITGKLLPEVLWQIIDMQTNFRYEIIIDDIVNGKYRALLYNIDTLEPIVLRASDAVLFSYISKTPIYIETSLMEKQSVPYNSLSSGISLPVNVLEDEMLKEALNRAIKDENYELASHLRDEIQRRKDKK